MLMATPNTMADAIVAVDTVEPFINKSQLQVCLQNARSGEERQYFIDMLVDLAERIKSMPTTYQTQDEGSDSIAYLHYFLNDMDFYITERDISDAQLQAFGLAKIWEAEFGYISIAELLENNMELDLYWTPKPISECK